MKVCDRRTKISDGWKHNLIISGNLHGQDLLSVLIYIWATTQHGQKHGYVLFCFHFNNWIT